MPAARFLPSQAAAMRRARFLCRLVVKNPAVGFRVLGDPVASPASPIRDDVRFFYGALEFWHTVMRRLAGRPSAQ